MRSIAVLLKSRPHFYSLLPQSNLSQDPVKQSQLHAKTERTIITHGFYDMDNLTSIDYSNEAIESSSGIEGVDVSIGDGDGVAKHQGLNSISQQENISDRCFTTTVKEKNGMHFI